MQFWTPTKLPIDVALQQAPRVCHARRTHDACRVRADVETRRIAPNAKYRAPRLGRACATRVGRSRILAPRMATTCRSDDDSRQLGQAHRDSKSAAARIVRADSPSATRAAGEQGMPPPALPCYSSTERQPAMAASKSSAMTGFVTCAAKRAVTLRATASGPEHPVTAI